MFARILIFAFLLMTISTFAQQPAPPLEPGVSQTLAKWRAANYSDVRYKLNITLEKGAPLMKGDIEIRVNLTDEGAKNDLILDWRTTQFASDKDKPFADVAAVNEANAIGAQASPLANVAESGVKPSDSQQVYAPTSFSRSALNASETLALQSNEHLIIPKKFLKTGENVIKISFASPIKTSGAAITRYVDKEDGAEYVYSLFVPSDASTAFPVFDQPDLKARFQLTVGAPEDWDVISNTSPFVTDNLGATVFPETKPISTYLFAFAAGNFDVFIDGYSDSYRQLQSKKPSDDELSKFLNSKKSRIYVRQSQAEKFKKEAAEVFRLNREGVKFLESWFDYKFPFPKYDLVLIPEFPFGGMEHAGATFLREDRVIFPTEPTKNDYITRANVIFHEAAHQWFGDTVTMKWFDDLWLKEGFAEFMAYKTMEKVLPEYNAWKIFYERNKQAAYLTDSTRGTTPIYQEIPNLSAAKSAYGNIVYRKAPSFLRQAEFYLGEDKFQTAVRAFLKKHEFANAEWTDLVKEFETASKQNLKDWADVWVTERGMPVFRTIEVPPYKTILGKMRSTGDYFLTQKPSLQETAFWKEKTKVLLIYEDGSKQIRDISISRAEEVKDLDAKIVQLIEVKKNLKNLVGVTNKASLVFPNYQDYGYGIFLLDEKSRAYVLENIGAEKDDFLRSMMWGSLWDSVRFYELAPEDYVKLVIKNINVETDESTIQTLLGRVSIAMNYYLSEPPAVAGGLTRTMQNSQITSNASNSRLEPSATADGSDKAQLAAQIETLLINKMQNAPTLGQRITFYRAFLNIASSDKARTVLKDILSSKFGIEGFNCSSCDGLVIELPKDSASAQTLPGGSYRHNIKFYVLKAKDKFDIVTKLITLGDADGLKLLAELEKNNTDDAAKRYAYAAKAGIATAENKAKYWKDFTENKEISESYIESAFTVWNSPKHADLTLPYLEKSLAELPNLKRNRKIFFVNGWLSSFIGGQKSEQALNIINKFLADNPNLDNDLRLKILENSDNLERSVKIRAKYAAN